MVLLDAGTWNGTAPTRALTAALQRFGDKRAKVRRAAQAAVVEVRQHVQFNMYSLFTHASSN
jgi:hypothetical protein